MISRLMANWVYGGAMAGVLLVLLTPLIIAGWPGALAITFLQLPVYMLHQYEEHDDDRFRRFFNQVIGRGREVLTPGAVFVVNVPGVWGVIALAMYLVMLVNPGFGLIAIYLTLVNAVVHVLAGVVLRRYNPGLVTAVLMFLPLSAFSLLVFHRAGIDGAVFQAVGLASAIGIHLAIIAYARWRMART
jgi:hypothetical protein